MLKRTKRAFAGVAKTMLTTFVPPTNWYEVEGAKVIGKLVPSVPPRMDKVCERVPQAGGRSPVPHGQPTPCSRVPRSASAASGRG